MEELLSKTSSASQFVSVLCILFCFNIVFNVGKFLWEMLSKKSELSEQSIKELIEALLSNTESVKRLEFRINEMESVLAQIPQMKANLRRSFAAIKAIAGKERWAEIREEIMHDESDML